MRILMLVVALGLLIPACGAADSTDDGTKVPAKTLKTQPETPDDTPEVPAPPADTPAKPSGNSDTIVLDIEGMH